MQLVLVSIPEKNLGALGDGGAILTMMIFWLRSPSYKNYGSTINIITNIKELIPG